MLEIKELTCGYNGTSVLSRINLTVEKKDFLGITGPNGVGKTTLFRAIGRGIKPVKGKIYLDGKNIWEMENKEIARKIAVVSQNVKTGFMTVEEFILLGRIPHYNKFQFFETAKDIEIVKKCMQITGVFKFRNHPIEEISGGERQLTLIARALAQEPRLLLLDEPTVHLDIRNKKIVLEVIKKLNKEFNLTIIVVLHDLNLTMQYCNRVALMSEGQIYKTGSPQEVLTVVNINEIYKIKVAMVENPQSFRPHIFI